MCCASASGPQGQWFSAIDGYKVYLLGNPVIWWGNIVVFALFGLVFVYDAFRRQRGMEEAPEAKGECPVSRPSGGLGVP